MNDTIRSPYSISFRKLLVACSALISVTALQVGVARADNALHDGQGTRMTAPKAPKVNVVAASAGVVDQGLVPSAQSEPALLALNVAADVTWDEGLTMDSGSFALSGSAVEGPVSIADVIPVETQAANEEVPLPIADELKGFEQVAALAPSDLNDLRGGFVTNTGVVFNFGFDVSTMIDGVLHDHVILDSQGNVTKNGGSFTIPTSGVLIDDLTDGQTHLKFSFGSNGIMSIIQNFANNRIIQSQGTFSLDTTGLSQALKGALGNLNLLSNLQAAFRNHH